MFMGTYRHRLDSKGRLTLPSRFRGELGGEVVITRGLDRCLLLFPMSRWEDLAERLDALPIGPQRARRARRWLFSLAHAVAPDRMGRVLVPAELREYAGIDHEVVVTGQKTYIELWAPEAWKDEMVAAQKDGLTEEQWEQLGI